MVVVLLPAVLLVLVSLSDASPRARLGGVVYPDVHEHHDTGRDEEGAECGVQHVADVLAQLQHTDTDTSLARLGAPSNHITGTSIHGNTPLPRASKG